jgi:hypothetical protein
MERSAPFYSLPLICYAGSVQYNCRLLMQDEDCGNPAGKKTTSP